MKKLFILAAIITATSFIATKGYSQVFVGARIGVGPARIGIGVPVAPRPYVVHSYVAPAPVVYDEFPGYVYYNYPAWNGHFRDRIYFEHYAPMFVRTHPAFRASYRGRW